MNLARLKALIIKESLQIMRDPSSILIAAVLPLLLLFLYGYGVNLDSNNVRIGIVQQAASQDITNLTQAFSSSSFLDVKIGNNIEEFENDLIEGNIRGIIVIPQNFDALVSPTIQVIADGSEPNIASFVQNYSRGVLQVWLDQKAQEAGKPAREAVINVVSRFWYNPELKSRNFLVPGAIAIIMTLIGTLLTALVVSREWERGTMEAMMATPATIFEILLGKLLPYYFLAMGSMIMCVMVAILYYEVPFRGSFLWLYIIATLFLFAALGQGLLISTSSRDQFFASQFALMSGFLPAFMLSGFIFEINSMPLPIRTITYLIHARYLVTSLQTLFLTGNVTHLLVICAVCMFLIGTFFFTMTARKTRKRLD